VAVAHSREILLGNDRTTVIQEDLRRPDAILDHPQLHDVLDLAKPVALLLVAILHFIEDSNGVTGILARLTNALAPGSFLVISHWCQASRPNEWEELNALVAPRLPIGVTSRTRDEVEAFFAGFELIPPGVVWAPQWRPDHGNHDEHPERASNLVGVGRKT
jgi:S-adenosyl methyltransferase